MLSRGTGVPLRYQLRTILRKIILSGEIQQGAHFPTEDSLIRKYKVSRTTVRQALADLQREQLITRKQGKGTSVAEKIELKELPRLSGMGMDPVEFDKKGSRSISVKTRVINFSRLTANKRINDLLSLPEGSDTIRIERVRMTNNGPIYYMLNYLPLDIGENIDPKLLCNKTLIEVLEVTQGIVIKKAMQSIEADSLDNYVCSLLNAREGAQCLVLKRVSYDQHDRAVEYLEASFRADQYMQTDVLTRQKKGHHYKWNRT